ncbi:4'-phosphopantetheinyl transferase family protein [Pseudidiomarina woesei]|uniref:4'-phosphopantetheinyl transferase N-terminal domain-containing protein n=1 Tax=Pseudidiomarina woesei TaxID=1381080 RepID=A0A0K6H8P8_9GAMM|nr:hypothetical protein [Pseudidiomarina woesei]CUA87376.1 hypothetical protein Ga0061064_1781 [Pseudidiomarina woesei]
MIATAYSTDFDTLLPALEAWVTQAEREAAQIYRQLPRQQQYLAGRGLLRRLVCETWHCAAGAVSITRQENGAPLLTVGGNVWQCSISHTKGAVLVAASPEFVVGVDVELIKPRKRLADLVSQYQHGFFADVNAENWSQFYQRWTLAEAVTKAEQGLLLNTLKRPVANYGQQAVHQCEQQFMFCCYSAKCNKITLNKAIF